jgi:hypothetical protein
VSVLDKVRRWIDGESAELVLEAAARDAQIKPRSKAEEFIVKIARAVEEVMQNEMVPLPQGTTIIPTEYIIFLSEEDDKEWQGAKRRGLEQGLYHVLAERAKEIAGKKKLETQSFAVELRVDGTLEKEDIRVQHSWEDSSGNKTGVLARKKPPVKPSPPHNQPPPYNQPPQPNPNSNIHTQTGSNFPPPNYNPIPPADFNPQAGTMPQNHSQVTPLETGEREEMTAVSPRSKALFYLEVWRGGVRQNLLPIFQNEVVIGRGSKSKPVDIALAGDPEVSRRHLLLILDRLGNYSVINEGRNPAMVNNTELPTGQRISVAPGQPVMICSYMIRIQPAQ